MKFRLFQTLIVCALTGCIISMSAFAATTTVSEFAPNGTLLPGVWEELDVRPGGAASTQDLTGAGGDLESNQPLPKGAALITTDFTNAAKAEVGVYDNYGLMGDITASLQLGFDFHKAANGGQNAAAAPSIKLTVWNPVCDDPGSAGDCYGTLIWEAYQQGGGNPATDTWTHVDIDANTGTFWWTGGFGFPNGAGGGKQETLAQWLVDFSSDFQDAILIAVSVGVGTYNQGQIGYFDNVGISHAFDGGFDELYDFEPPGPGISKEITAGNDVDSNGEIDVVVAQKPGAAHEYSFDIDYDANGDDTPVLIVDTVPAEWIVDAIEDQDVDVDECGESDEADGGHGEVDVYKNGKGKKCKSATTIEWMPMDNPPSETLSFDGNVSPDVIFGSGNANGSFTIDSAEDIEVGLRAKLRFNNACAPENTFNSNGDGTYSFAADNADGCTGWADTTTPVWNFEWAVNTDTDDESDKLADFTYLMGMDADPTLDTEFFEFDPINVPCADHALGDNTTVNGGGTNPGCGGYAAALSSFNVAQNSWNYEFFDGFPPIDGFDPNVDGVYDIFLAVFDGGSMVAYSRIQVIVGNGSTSNGLDVDLSTRESPGKGHKDTVFAPTSCGALYLNDGAIALEKDGEGNIVLDEFGDPVVVAGPSNALCVAVVDQELLPGDGYDAAADHDGDGLASHAEACGGIGTDPCLTDTDGDGVDDGIEVASGCMNPLLTDTDDDGLDDGVEDANQNGVVDDGETDPCNPDTDDDGVNDGNDNCPLEGPPDPLLGELLDANGCIFQSQCSDGLDNDNDGLIDFAGGDASCTDIIDDSEDTFDDTDSDGVGNGFDACPLGGGVTNGSFEDFDHAGTPNYSDGAPGWTFSAAGGGDWKPHPSQTCMNPFIQDIPDGDQVGYSNAAEITQDFGIAIEDGKAYTLSVWVGGRCGLVPDGYSASLTADGSDSGTGASGNTAEGWSELSLTLNGTGGNAGQALGVNLANTSNSVQVNWDHAVLAVDGDSTGCVASP